MKPRIIPWTEHYGHFSIFEDLAQICMDNLELFPISLTQARTTVNSFLFILHFQSQALLQGEANTSFLEDEEAGEYAYLHISLQFL